MTVTIQQGDSLFYCEEDYDAVCKAIVDGRPLVVRRASRACRDPDEKITFFSAVDWVAIDL